MVVAFDALVQDQRRRLNALAHARL